MKPRTQTGKGKKTCGQSACHWYAEEARERGYGPQLSRKRLLLTIAQEKARLADLANRMRS